MNQDPNINQLQPSAEQGRLDALRNSAALRVGAAALTLGAVSGVAEFQPPQDDSSTRVIEMSQPMAQPSLSKETDLPRPETKPVFYIVPAAEKSALQPAKPDKPAVRTSRSMQNEAVPQATEWVSVVEQAPAAAHVTHTRSAEHNDPPQVASHSTDTPKLVVDQPLPKPEQPVVDQPLPKPVQPVVDQPLPKPEQPVVDQVLPNPNSDQPAPVDPESTQN